MNKDPTSAADIIACLAIFATIVSGSINVSQGKEINRLTQLSEQQAQQRQVM